MTKVQQKLIWAFLVVFCFLVGCLAGLRSTATFPHLGLISSLFVLIAAAPSYVAFVRVQSQKRGLLILLALSIFAYAIEILGVQTSFPYSSFVYNHSLQPLLIAGVPWTTPFGWIPLVLASFVTAAAWVDTKKIFPVVGLATLLLVVFDLALDPGAVRLALWSYTHSGWYHGVPWQNFAGWLLTGSIALLGLRIASRLTLHPGSLFFFLIGPVSLLSFWIGVALSAKQLLPTLIGCLLLTFFTQTWRTKSTKIIASP